MDNDILQKRHGIAAPSTPIGREALLRVVTAALRAPSGDNCQPWLFHWDGRHLRIFQDDDRARHALNRANHASYLSLGCVIESLRIAASHEGMDIAVELGADRPACRASFTPARNAPDGLLPALAKRETNRSVFEGGSADDPVFGAIRDDSNRFRNAQIKIRQNFHPHFYRFLTAADAFVFADRRAHRDLFRWLRFGDDDVTRTRDGMSWRNLGVSLVESRILRLARRWGVQRFLNRIGFLKQLQKDGYRALRSSAAIACITVTSDGPEALLEAGRIWLRSWCRLNDAGYGVQPLTSAALGGFDSETSSLPSDTDGEFRRLFSRAPDIIRSAFDVAPHQKPIVLFRTGLAAPLPAGHRTLRRNIEDVLTFD